MDYDDDRELRALMLERHALEFLLANDGMEGAALDALAFIAGADATSVAG